MVATLVPGHRNELEVIETFVNDINYRPHGGIRLMVVQATPGAFETAHDLIELSLRKYCTWYRRKAGKQLDSPEYVVPVVEMPAAGHPNGDFYGHLWRCCQPGNILFIVPQDERDPVLTPVRTKLLLAALAGQVSYDSRSAEYPLAPSEFVFLGNIIMLLFSGTEIDPALLDRANVQLVIE